MSNLRDFSYKHAFVTAAISSNAFVGRRDWIHGSSVSEKLDLLKKERKGIKIPIRRRESFPNSGAVQRVTSNSDNVDLCKRTLASARHLRYQDFFYRVSIKLPAVATTFRHYPFSSAWKSSLVRLTNAIPQNYFIAGFAKRDCRPSSKQRTDR